MSAALRITSSRAPYRRAGLTFLAEDGKTIAVIVASIDDVTPGCIGELIEDAHLDVLLGAELPEHGFVGTPLRDLAHFEQLIADISLERIIVGQQTSFDPGVAERMQELVDAGLLLDRRESDLAIREAGLTSRHQSLEDRETALAAARLELERGRPDDDATEQARPIAQDLADAGGDMAKAGASAPEPGLPPIDPPAAQVVADAASAQPKPRKRSTRSNEGERP